MKKLLLLLLLLPFTGKAQKVNDMLDRVSMIEFIVGNPNGQLIFRQTKSWCTDFLDLTEVQSSKMDELFNKQYIELAQVYKKYNTTNSPEDLDELVDVILHQEERFRDLLTPKQLGVYKTKFAETKLASGETKNKAFNNLFFSDEMLVSYRQ